MATMPLRPVAPASRGVPRQDRLCLTAIALCLCYVLLRLAL